MPPLAREPGKTGRLYASLKASHFTDGNNTDRFVVLLSTRKGIVPSAMFNAFDSVAADAFDGIELYKTLFSEEGAIDIHLAGSGPTLYTLVEDKERADQICLKLRKKGLESYLVQTVSSMEDFEL